MQSDLSVHQQVIVHAIWWSLMIMKGKLNFLVPEFSDNFSWQRFCTDNNTKKDTYKEKDIGTNTDTNKDSNIHIDKERKAVT